MIFPIPNSKYRVLKEVYHARGIRFTEIMRKAKISTKIAEERLKDLMASNAIIEEVEKSGNKVLNRKFYPNLSSEEGAALLSLLELEKKWDFLKRYPDLGGPFNHLLRDIGGNIKVVLVFGSYANYSASKDSDLDLLFLADREIDLKKIIERSFSTVDYELSPRIELMKDFRKNINDSIHKTIIQNHIVLFGASSFINLVKTG